MVCNYTVTSPLGAQVTGAIELTSGHIRPGNKSVMLHVVGAETQGGSETIHTVLFTAVCLAWKDDHCLNFTSRYREEMR